MNMSSRHEGYLLGKLEEVSELGFATVSNTQLLLWYRRERITPSIFKDILSKWEEHIEDVERFLEPEEKNCPLFIGDNGSGYVLVWGQGLTAAEGEKASWLRDIRDVIAQGSSK